MQSPALSSQPPSSRDTAWNTLQPLLLLVLLVVTVLSNIITALYAMPLPHLATATPTINIATTAITDDHILCLDANIFTPTLDEYLVARNNPIKVTIPLKGADFSDASFGGIFLDHFDDMVLTISRGYNDSEPELFLNKTQ